MNGTTPRVRYVCLSDLHLGAQHGLLTAVDGNGNTEPLYGNVPAAEQLCECFARLLNHQGEQEKERPTLILLGDAMELALTTDANAYMAFERFIHLAFVKHKLFNRIVYVPGNHDHHLWEVAREMQYVDRYLGYALTHLRGPQPALPPEEARLESPWHGTRMFVLEKWRRRTPLYVAQALVRRFPELSGMHVHTAYPHFAIRTRDGRRALVFHHGHYLEDLYLLLSIFNQITFGAAECAELEQIEADNFAWVDFFWSTMGRCGAVGPNINLLYTLGTQSPERLVDYAPNVARGLVHRYLRPSNPFLRLFEPLEEESIEHAASLFFKLIQTTSRWSKDKTSDDPMRARVRDHVTGPVGKALVRECLDNRTEGYTPRFPEELAFVFGHTHKPDLWQETMSFADGSNGQSYHDVEVYNVGGWVIDTVDANPHHGAAAILVGDFLQTCYLHLYSEDGSEPPAATALPPNSGPNAEFARHIQDLLDRDATAWAKLATVFADTRTQRAETLRRVVADAHERTDEARHAEGRDGA
jgi:hypothetical protein